MLLLKGMNKVNKVLNNERRNAVSVVLVDLERDPITGEPVFVFEFSCRMNTVQTIKSDIQRLRIVTGKRFSKRRNLTSFEKILRGDSAFTPSRSVKHTRVPKAASMSEIKNYEKASGEAIVPMLLSSFASQCQYCESVNQSLLDFGTDLRESLNREENADPIKIENDQIKTFSIYQDASDIQSAGGTLENTFDYENSKIVGQSVNQNYYQQQGDDLKIKTVSIDGAIVINTPVEVFLPPGANSILNEAKVESIENLTVGLDQTIQVLAADTYSRGVPLTTVIDENIEEIITAGDLYGQHSRKSGKTPGIKHSSGHVDN